VLMAPYSWHLEVPVWDTPCFCVGQEAREYSRMQVITHLGTLESYKAAYKDIIRAHCPTQPPDPEGDVFRAGWYSYIEDYGRAERQAFFSHPKKNTPNPECHICQGTGFRKSIKNPQAKWDTYKISQVLPVADILSRGDLFLHLIRPQGIVSAQGWRDLGTISPLTKAPVLQKGWHDLLVRVLRPHASETAAIVACEI